VGVRTARLLVLDAAEHMDHDERRHGRRKEGIRLPLSRETRLALAACKVAVPEACEMVLDFAVQIHGGGGLSADHPLAAMWAACRTLRVVDGATEVHLQTLGRSSKRNKEVRRDSKTRQLPGVGHPKL
jgi:alkylation response protein AidB-like acyl-CoA dehydrogenase